jgi:hypothetical protein
VNYVKEIHRELRAHEVTFWRASKSVGRSGAFADNLSAIQEINNLRYMGSVARAEPS